MRVFIVLLVDSIRMLRSQKMFWVVLGLSAIVAFFFASIGVDENGVSVLFGLWGFDSEILKFGDTAAKQFTLAMFTEVIVPWWLNMIAVILALISCASIFPEFVAKGSVDLFVSKPPSRLMLFLGKYLGSLIFVLAQVLLFTVIVFVNLGIRFGDWNFTVFWAVPLVVFTFSLVYAVHVFISVWSGSAIFGLLAAFLVWGVSVMAEWTELWAYNIVYAIPQMSHEMEREYRANELAEKNESEGSEEETAVESELEDDFDEEFSPDEGGAGVYRVINAVRVLFPKTRVAAEQLNQLIKVDGEDLTGISIGHLLSGESPSERTLEIQEKAQKRHSVPVDIGSSLFFELIFLGFGALIFCRRDY